MRLPAFTLVHQPGVLDAHRAMALEGQWLKLVRRAQPAAARSLGGLPAELRSTLLGSCFSPSARPQPKALSALRRIVYALGRRDRVISVGIWDLGARAGHLPRVIERMNDAQTAFVFFEVQAAIPAGLVSRPERVAAWAQAGLGRPLTDTERGDLSDNVIDVDFFDRARGVRRDLGIDCLIGITPTRVASQDTRAVDWNDFSSWDDRIVLASTFDVRRLAAAAGRPFETLVAGVILAQLLVAMHAGLAFHRDNRRCLFDFSDDQVSAVRAARQPRIEPLCLMKIDPAYRDSAVALVKALGAYRGRRAPRRPENWVTEERHGVAGAQRASGGLGAMSGPPR